jgi:glycosyltransferase involved in cell wall biosynthesis
MKLIINTAHQRFGGAIQVALSFINECKNFSEHEYHVFLGYGVGKSIDKSAFPKNFLFYDFDFGEIGFKTIRVIQRTLRPLEEKIKPDVLISTSGPTYYHSIAPQIVGFNLPLYIYPESPFLQSMSFKQKLKLWIKKQVHFFYFKRDAVAYVVQTDDVNQRVRKALKTKKVYTVTNNHSAFYSDESLAVENKLNIKFEGEFRFLTLTSFYGHKNLDIIPEIAELLKRQGVSNVRFVLTLKQEDLEKHGLKHDFIYNVGPLKPQECPSLYKECDAMFLPTLAECFSASYPEAMVMRKPIVTSDLGFARSICRDSALYFKAKSAKDACKSILTLVEDDNLRHHLMKMGQQQLRSFDSASNRAKKYIDLCIKYAQIN